MFAIVIPTFEQIDLLADAIVALEGCKIFVVDASSIADIHSIYLPRNVSILHCKRGRGQQLGAGAEAAIAEGAESLLFLHADTVLSAGWFAEAQAFTNDPDNQNMAAVFTFRVDDQGSAARRLEGLVAWRTKVLALPYGDQGLLISKDFYLSLGGYKELELMEDVDLVRRIGGKRLRVLSATATTSAAKYQQAGYLRRSTRNLICLGLFFLGVPVRWINRIYS
jgi:hypothetical protein